MTSRVEIQALFKQGKRIGRPALLVLWRDTDTPRRAGFAVTRQIRGAVHRNRARRRLREAFRATRQMAPANGVMVVVAKRAALDEPFTRLTAQLREALSAIPGARTDR